MQATLDFERADQPANLARVSSNLADPIRDFMAAHVGGTFHLCDLAAYVQARCTAPSVDRILRLLKRAGEVNYVVVNRSASEYRSLPLASST